MQKIIDIRFRPPIGSFLEMTMYKDKERTAQMMRATGMDLEMPSSVINESTDLLIKEMDSIGNYIGCVSGLKRGLHSASGWIENNEIFEIVKNYPSRFVGVGAIDGGDGKKALEDIDICIREYGFKAIVIEPGAQKEPMYADDRRLYPIYSKCVEMGVPVFLLVGGKAGPNIGYIDPVHVDNVAADMEKLKIVVLHGAWPWITQILCVAYRRPNVYLSADMYISFPGGDQYIRAINSYLSDRFLYSSAYPFCPLAGYLKEFRKLKIKEEYLDNILYKNAEELLKLF